MKRARIREIVIWLTAAVLAFYCMSARPFSHPLLGGVPDFFYALAFCASFFFPDSRGLAVALAMGLIKDLSFSVVIGPGLLAALFTYAGARFFFRSRFPEQQWPYFLQGVLIGLPARYLRILLLKFLPLPASLPLSLSQRLLRESLSYLRALPALLLALALTWLFFRLNSRWLTPTVIEEGPLVAEDPGRVL